jgi:hypothetical protein
MRKKTERKTCLGDHCLPSPTNPQYFVKSMIMISNVFWLFIVAWALQPFVLINTCILINIYIKFLSQASKFYNVDHSRQMRMICVTMHNPSVLIYFSFEHLYPCQKSIIFNSRKLCKKSFMHFHYLAVMYLVVDAIMVSLCLLWMKFWRGNRKCG